MKLYQRAHSATLANSTFWHSYFRQIIWWKKVQPALKLLFSPLPSKFLYTRYANMCEVLLPHFSHKQCFNAMARAVTPVPTSRPLSCSDVLARFYASLIAHCSRPADATGASLWPSTKRKCEKALASGKASLQNCSQSLRGKGQYRAHHQSPISH